MMKIRMTAALCALAILGSAPAFADANRDAILQTLAAAAKQGDPSFSNFSTKSGKAFWTGSHAGGKPDTPSCTTCHTKDARAPGQTRAGKVIDPMAVSANPERFTDQAKVDKWFGRNCSTVLGRECSAQEKGDIITYLSSL